MTKKVIWLVVCCVMALSLIMASCGGAVEEEEEETIGEEEEVVVEEEEEEEGEVPSGKGDWWDKFGEPQYGGTITLQQASDPLGWDPYFNGASLAIECLGAFNWALDREIWDYKSYQVPVEYRGPYLAESWETPDLNTTIFHIRKGIHWQNIPPVNGREFTAYDAEYSWNRILGLGKYGFTERSPYVARAIAPITEVTATDKYTLVFKTEDPNLEMLNTLLDHHPMQGRVYVASEAIEQWGDVNDWEHSMGTGPFILDGYVTGSTITYSRNPSYWGFDERYPENRLPYADKLKFLIISDMSTTLAALRTGKIDLVRNVDWETALQTAKLDPELLQITVLSNGPDLDMRCDKEPFSDIRVRKALQMAIDRETIAETYYGGTADPTPYGMVGYVHPGYYVPFDEWPQDVKEGYIFNTEKAKELLDEAGYPDGFKTDIVASNTDDLDLYQIVIAQLADIGVDAELKPMESGAFSSYVFGGADYGLCTGLKSIAQQNPLQIIVKRRDSKETRVNRTHNNDPDYDAIYAEFLVCTDRDEQKEIVKKADMYAIEKHWTLSLMPNVSSSHIYQPWFKGFSGENWLSSWYYSRFFVDQDLKKAMGH